MGRNKKYLTPEEKQKSRGLASKKYYWKNKEQEDAKAKERYHRNLQNNKPNR
jgi:hypothetical protein